MRPKVISHRGNIFGVTKFENAPKQIDMAMLDCDYVEIDVRYIDGKFFLGHDTPDTFIEDDWLRERSNKLFVHCKNIEALNKCMQMKIPAFFHEKETHVHIVNTDLIWTHSLKESQGNSIIPLITEGEAKWHRDFDHVWGICTDFPLKILHPEEF